MNVSSWLWCWLDAPPPQPSTDLFDHSAKLSLRKLEDRQVLSVTPFFDVMTGDLSIDLTGGDDVSLKAIGGEVWQSTDGGMSYQQLDGDSVAVGTQVVLTTDVISITVDGLDGGDHSIDLSQVVGGASNPFDKLSSVTITTGAGADTITGSSIGDMIDGGAGNDSLDGGLGNDLFVFGDGFGADTVVDLVGGTDTLSFSTVTSNVAVSLLTHTVTVDGNTVDFTVDQIDAIIGHAAGNDSFHGLDAASTWTIGATHSYSGGSATITFTGFETLEGGSDSDTFLLNVDSSQTLDGNGGTDTLSYAGHSANISVNLSTPTATGLTSLSDIENVIGSSGDDTLTGDDFDNVLTGGGGLDTLLGGLGNDTLVNGYDSDGQGGTDIITISSALTTSNGVGITLTAETINLNANLSTDAGTSAGAMSLTGAVVVGTNLIIDTDHASGTDGAITITGSMDADAAANARSLTLTAGGGGNQSQRRVGRCDQRSQPFGA